MTPLTVTYVRLRHAAIGFTLGAEQPREEKPSQEICHEP